MATACYMTTCRLATRIRHWLHLGSDCFLDTDAFVRMAQIRPNQRHALAPLRLTRAPRPRGGGAEVRSIHIQITRNTDLLHSGRRPVVQRSWGPYSHGTGGVLATFLGAQVAEDINLAQEIGQDRVG
jgi:hypothetical protein